MEVAGARNGEERMSAVFTGNGLGLFNTSLSQLGTAVGGNGGIGQGPDRQYVNVATGNLLLQGQDEFLTFRGLGIGFVRTYNSQGFASEVGNDGWVTGFERRVALHSGTFNAAGSVMRRHTGDGSFQDFTYVSANTYRSTAGDGAHDTLTWHAETSTWRYVEGSTRMEDQYANHADATLQGRLIRISNLKSASTPMAWEVLYNASHQIVEIRVHDGAATAEALLFSYDGQGRLSSVATRENGVVRGQVFYAYDGQGRLSSVTTDLTPDNATDNVWNNAAPSSNNGRLFRTQYTYEGTSLRLATVKQSDGTLVSYTYHADGRIKTVTRGDTNTNDADGAGETTSYAYGVGTTTVTDSLGRSWIYAYDANGQLTSVTAPPVDGQSDITTYQYDDAGNLIQARSVRGATTLALVDSQYDSMGNLLWQWDAQGNAVSRTYNASNQVLTETRYTGVDPDRTGSALPTGGMTTHFVYDGLNRLRFVVNPLGEVTGYNYYATTGTAIGRLAETRQYTGAAYAGAMTETAINSWILSTDEPQRPNSTSSVFVYDLWGRLSQRTDYATVNGSGTAVLDAGTTITRYTYDAQGLLRQQITLRGAGRTVGGAVLAGSEVTDYAYDGMGRLLSVVKSTHGEASTDANTIQTTYAYIDSDYRIAVTTDAGMTRTEVRNAAGRVVSIHDSGVVSGGTVSRITTNVYDSAGQLRISQDAGGGRSFFFYDAKGRLEATVNATGEVIRTSYDGMDRVVGTRAYANRVTTTSWSSLATVPASVAGVALVANNALDRVTGLTYDTAGRVLTSTDGLAGSQERSITTYTYDAAGRVLQTRTTDSANTSATARVVRYFHDAAGREIGVLDAAGYLTETQYDRAGRVVAQTRYATVSPSAHWASGTLAQLRPAASAANDQTTRHYYDGQGRRVGILDAQGYLTEWVYDEAGNTRAERRYNTGLIWQSGDTLATLRSRAGASREIRMAYNGLGQLATQTNPEGTVTRYTYDEAGRLVRTESAQGTSEVREGHRRYNVFGELIGELSGEAAPHLLPGMTESQLDAVYAQHGVRHGYDALGRRIESVDAAGNRTWYFYDAAGRPTFTVQGVAGSNGVANAQGEVTETRYNAFGQASEQIAYTGRIALAVPGSRASVASAISVLSYVAATDTRRQYAYTSRGQLAGVTDAEGAITQYSYDAFGQMTRQVTAVGTAAASTTDFSYDKRGLLTATTEGVGTAVQRQHQQAHDAFGRVISRVDARGHATQLGYDRIGRLLTVSQTVQGRVETTSTSYDAHGRIVSVTDAESYTTQYVHNDAARTLQVITPEGITVTTTHNRHGQTVLVADAAGSTAYTYNRDGQLIQTQRKGSDNVVVREEQREYGDARGLLTATVDGSGRRVELHYDAAGRVLRRIEDPAGLALTTTYAYDGQGRQLTVTDPSGRITGYQYDREGRLTQLAQDPGGLNLRTQFTYDAAGRQFSVTDGAGTAAARTTQYAYDNLGRRISETVDPGAGKLNITTSYAYDKNDNVIRRTDANGQVTRFYYDEDDRLVYVIDALGGMTRHWYDKAGRLVATRSFVQATDPTTLTDSTTLAQLGTRLSWQTADRGEYRVLDGDGRLRFTVDIGGAVTETVYDAAGRVVGTRAYAATYSPGSALLDGLSQGTVTPAQIVPTADNARDLRIHHVLDAAGQVRLAVDALGNVRELQYDKAGRLVGSIAYAQPAALTTTLRNQLQAGTATVAGVLATVTPNAARDMVVYRVHDAAGRLRYTVDAIGAVREILYDAVGLEVGSRAYASTLTVNAALRAKLQAGTATANEINTLLAPSLNDARNVEQFQVRDAAGRVRFLVSVLRDASGAGTGLLSELKYDEAGRLVERSDRETPVSAATLNANLAALRGGTANLGTITSWMTGSLRTTYWVHDAAGRVRYTLQADSASTLTVSERRYDALGQVVAEVGFAVTVPAATTRTLAGVASAVTASGGDAADQHRLTRLVYNANGRLRFRIDDAGGVTEIRYDALGRITQNRQYALLIPASTQANEAAVAAAVAGQSGANVRITHTAYNAAGRIASVTDAAEHTESYAYDAIGQRTRLTNKLGHVWTYAYDAAGRLIEEISPVVTVATATVTGTVSTATRSVKTVLAYDALGNVISRTEDATGPTPRITQYQYDSRGNQIRTTFPDAWQIDPATGALVATGQTPTTEVTYDALGRAVVQKDVRGNYSYKVYDSLGRVAYDIDQEGYATGYVYNAFGEQSQLRRHATKVNFAGIGGFTAGTAIQLSQLTASVVVASAAQDRVIATTYDRRGLQIQVQQSEVTYIKADGTSATGTPVTQFSYNAFGELARTSELLDQSANLWAHTYRYYDELGRNTLNVDAEGYITQFQYNAIGEVTQVREFARALSPTMIAGLTIQAPPPPPAAGDAVVGYDRVVQYTYDAMGRKASESALRHFGRADGSQGVRQVATAWTYDAAGQAIVTNVDGQQTKTAYDALGRVTAIEEAAQQRLVNTAEAQLLGNNGIGLGVQSLYATISPYTALAYDAYGNVIRVVRYANGLAQGQSTPVADATNDQVSVSMYDRQGRAVMNRDAEGNRVFLQYDATDNIVHSWYALSSGSGGDVTVRSHYTYDAAGRQVTARTQRDGQTAPDQLEVVRYNAFGEIVAKGDNDAVGAVLPAEFQYDRAGRMVASNAEGGVWREYGYNLAGHQARQSYSVYVGPGNVTAVTRYITDRLGRVVRMVLPSHTTNPAEINHMSQKVDRWGNVIEQVDPRGYQTQYQYNGRDQLVKEIRPLVRVVTTNEAGNWLRPELTWSYDELGRLVASRDGNGNTTRYEYDGAGKQIKVIDANGDVTLTAYDALGRARLTQNALGYLTFKQYDRLDRVTAHGDYLPAASGSTRQKKTLESYVLNQNGNRIQTTNALGKITRYDHDSRGLLLRSQTPMGVVMEYAYDLGGRRSLERYALSHTNVLDRDGETVRTNEQTWDYDYFGRLIDRNDLSGRDYDYVYDAASGQLKSETNSSGLNRTLLYYANGLIREIQEPGGTVYRYAYDQAGNRILEEAVVRDSRGKQYNVRTQIVYDSHNRLQRVVQDDQVTNKRVFELTYAYDAAGNRTHVVARTGYGENTAPIAVLDNAPMVIGLPANRVIRTGVASEFRVRLSDIFRDPEGKPLSISAVQVVSGNETALPAWLSYTVDAGTGEVVFASGTGSSAANNQSFNLRLKASDGTSISVVGFTLSVRSNTAPSNQAGAVTSFQVKTGRSWSLELPVDAYFTDPDVGDSLSIHSTVSPAAPWLTIDNSNPSVTRLSSAAPAAGTYTVTLTATDQLGATKTRTVTLTVSANAPPTVVAAIPAQQATQNRAFELERNLSAVFTDSHGDALSVTATLANGTTLPSWLGFSYLSNQEVRQLRFIGFVPGNVADGTVYQIRLTATDADGASVSTTFNLTVIANRAPTVVTTPPSQTMRVGQSLNLQLPISSLFVDPDGDAMTFELVHPQGSAKSGWVKLQLDQATGTLKLTGTPTNATNHTGSYSVQILARDVEGLTSVVSLSLQVKTDSPPARNTTVQVPDQTLSIGRSFSFTLPANMFTDAENDPITLLVGVATERSEWLDTVPPTWTFWVDSSPLPSWMSFNPSTRTISGTVPPGAQAHSFTIRVGAYDGRMGASQADVIGAPGNVFDNDITISVAPFVNSAPVYNTGKLPNRTLVHGGAVDFALPAGSFTEPDGDAMTYSAQVQVGSTWVAISQLGLSINATTGRITGTATNLTQASFNARIIAKDPQGAQGIGTFVFNITNTPPTSTTIPAQTAQRNRTWSFSLSPFFSDVNGNALTFIGSGLPAGLTLSSSGAITGSPTAPVGNYTVTVTANDGRSGTVTTSFTLAVVNSAPTPPTIPNQTATAGSTWSYVVPAFTDPNGDTLTYTVGGLPSWMSFNATTRTLSGTPRAVGTWTITVTATDTSGASASRSFTVTTPNVAPVVANAIGTRSVGRNQPWNFQVPANTFSDANNDTLTYSVGVLPSGISFNAATRTFSGQSAVLGNHTITVTVADGNGGTRSTSFTLSVVNNPPTYHGGLANRAGNRATSISWPLPSGTFSDPNSDTISYTLMVERPGYWQPYDIVPGEPDVRWVPPAWFPASNYSLAIHASNGTITGTLYPMVLESGTPSQLGQIIHDFRVKIVASDGNGGTAEGIFNVHVNELPTGSIPNRTIKSSVAWTYQIPAFSDPNGDTLAYSIVGSLPTGLAFNAGTRTFSGSVATAGTYTITVRVNDGQGGVVDKSFTLTVSANSAPVAPTIANQTATVGAAFSFTVPAFTDPDADALTYSATGLPPGLSFNTGSRVISGTPTTAGTYTVTVRAQDGRGGNTPKTFSITVGTAVPPNRAPVVSRQPPSPAAHFFSTNRWLVPISGFTLPVDTFTDPDNNPLTYTVLEKPSWLNYAYVAGSGHQFSGVNSDDRRYATHTIRIRASDPAGLSVVVTFTVTSEYDYFDPWNPTDPLSLPGQPVQLFQASNDLGMEPEVAPASMNLQASIVPRIEESWYAYDKLNRVSVVNGALENGQVVVAKNYRSYGLGYDAAGNQVSQYQWRGNGNTWWSTVQQQTYSLRGELVLTLSEQRLDGTGPSGVQEQRIYDAAGRMEQRLQYFGPGTVYQYVDQEATLMPIDVSGWLYAAEQNSYDDDGRLLTQIRRTRSEATISRTPIGANWAVEFPVWLVLPWDGGADQRGDLSVLTEATTINYAQGTNTGYDAAGRVKGYTYTGQGYTHTYVYTYEGWDSYREKTVTGSSSNSNYRTTTSTMTYDVAGRQTEIREKTNGVSIDDRVRSFAFDGNGMILSRRDGTVTSANVFQQKTAQGQTAAGDALGRMNHRNVYAGGQQVAALDEAGKLDVLSRMTAFSNSSAGRTQVAVQAGETLRSLAQRVYGNANLWYVLAAANALDGDGDLVAGTTLTVPEVKTSGNDANTFKPYNPGEITGSTSPGLPYIQPPDKGCGTLGLIIMVVVIVVVAYFTAGAASGAMTTAAQSGGATAFASTATVTTAAGATATTASLTTLGAMTAGAVGAAAGTAVGLAAGSAMGVASFSWRAVAQAGVSSFLTAGLANTSMMQGAMSLAGNSQFARSAMTAAAGQLTSYAASRIAGMEVSFSWRQIALHAVSAGITGAAMPRVGAALGINMATTGGQFAADMIGGVLGGTVAMHTGRRLGLGGEVNYGKVLSDAFGNTLGNAVTGRHAAQAEEFAQQVQTQNMRAQQQSELMARWAQEDAVMRERMMAAEEQSRLPGWSSSSRSGVLDASLDPRLLPDISLGSAGLTADERRRLATTTTYHTHHVDPYAIERNGGAADQHNLVQTFWVRDNPPVSIETLLADPVAPATIRISATEARNNRLGDSKQSAVEFWGRNVPMRMAAKAGYNIAQGVSSLYGMATDLHYGRKLQGAVGYAVQNPGAVAGALGQGLQGWWDSSLGDKLEGAGTFGIEMLASGGTALLTRTGTSVRTVGAVVDVAEEAAALRRIADLNATPRIANVEAVATRRAYLDEKYGRTGNIHTDINVAGNKQTVLRFASSMGLDEASARSILSGVDLTQSVDIIRVNSSKPFWQFQAPGAPQGAWYSSSSLVTPSELGIAPYGVNRAANSVELKVLNRYSTNSPVSVLRSTARPIDDFWSIPYGTFETRGGAAQWYSPQKEFFTPIPRP